MAEYDPGKTIYRDWSVEEYDDILPWWEDNRIWGEPVPREFLNTPGIVAEYLGKKVAVSFIYPTKTDYALVGGAVCDTGLDKSYLKLVLREISEKSVAKARSMGFLNPRLYVAIPGYVKLLRESSLSERGPARHSIYIAETYLPYLAES